MIKRPILFEDTTGAVTADTFRGNGLGVLIDAISCEVTEELDGVFELNMRYPQNGMHFAELKTRRIIYA
jgi:phage-related protein